MQTYDAAPMNNAFSGATQLGYAVASAKPIALGASNTIGLSIGGVVASTSVAIPLTLINPSNDFSEQIAVVALDADKNVIVPDNTGYFDANGNAISIAMSSSGAGNVLSFSPATITTPSVNGTKLIYTASNLTSSQSSTGFNGTITATPSNGATAGSASVSIMRSESVMTTFVTNSGFMNMHGLAIDSANNLYTASNSKIYKITPSRVISVLKSGLGFIWGLAFDSAGNLYAADFSYNRIYKITPSGALSTFSSSSLLYGPAGLVFDPSGNLYVSNWGPGQNGTTIIKINSNGTTATTYSTGNSSPQDMIFQANGTMLVCEYSAGYIGAIPNGGGTPTNVLTTGTSTQGLTADKNGNIWVTGNGGNSLSKYSASLTQLEALSVNTYGMTLIDDPESIRLDSAGNLYFVNYADTTITELVP